MLLYNVLCMYISKTSIKSQLDEAAVSRGKDSTNYIYKICKDAYVISNCNVIM